MPLDLTLELAQLLKFAGDTATAIRMYSMYNPSGKDGSFGHRRRDPELLSTDIMFLSDAITQLLGVGAAVQRGHCEEIACTCRLVRLQLESFQTDNPQYKPQAKPTFDFWVDLADLGSAITALAAIEAKAASVCRAEMIR